jgi:hypothetical protein
MTDESVVPPPASKEDTALHPVARKTPFASLHARVHPILAMASRMRKALRESAPANIVIPEVRHEMVSSESAANDLKLPSTFRLRERERQLERSNDESVILDRKL